jgi:long-chain acyl-CoA synthetase
MKQAFGGRVRFCITGAAPIQKDVVEFLKICVGAPIIEGYGQTESSGASFAMRLEDPTCGHVGGPFLGVEFKLISIPEMNYTV